MKLPAQLRLEIYRHAVVEKDTIYSLLPPALSQVSKQLRAEVLPLYYRENEFYISLDVDSVDYEVYPVRIDDDIDSVEYEEEIDPVRIDNDIDSDEFEEDIYIVRRDDEIRLAAFIKMCSDVAASGGLKHVTNLQFIYREPVIGDDYNYLLGFEFFAGSAGGARGKIDRIGNDDLDWHDFDAVSKAFNVTLDRATRDDAEALRQRTPVSAVIDVLFAVAKHCGAANRDVRLAWDYGH